MIQAAKKGLLRALRWSERYTKTDMVYLASGSFWLFLKRIFSGFIAAGLAIAFANLLNPTMYGEYKYVFSLFTLLAIPTLLGMGDAATKAVAQGFEGTPASTLKIKIAWGTLGSIASAAVALYYFVMGNNVLAGAFLIIAIFLPFVDTFGIFNSVLTGKRLFRVSIFYEIAVQGISALVIIITLFLTKNLVIILVSYFSMYTLTRLIAFRIVMQKYTENKDVDPTALSYGKHLSAMRIIGTVSESIDNILLWQFTGPAPLAVFAFAKAIPVQIREMFGTIPKLAFPKFAQRDFREIKKTLLRRMALLFFIMVGVVIAYAIVAPYIYRLFFPQYIDAILYSQLFALSLLFFPQKFIGTAFQAHAHKRALYISSTAAPIAKIILSIALIPAFGIMGAVLAEIGGRAVNFLILSFLFFTARA